MMRSALLQSAAHWLGAGAVDGALFAVVVWLASVTLLRRSTERVVALAWLAALVKFVVVQPLEMRAVPLRLAVARPGDAAPGGPGYGWLAIIYGVVVALLLTRMVVRQSRLRRRVAGFSRAEIPLMTAVGKAAATLGLAGLPDVRVSEEPLAPFTLGPWRPTLVLPRWICAPGARLDAVLLHELAHFARGDHWVLWFERLVATVFFFWPPVHWVSAKLDQARELACDERAIRRGALAPAEYGLHLVDVVAAARGQRAMGGALAIGSGSGRLERRIDRLLAASWGQRTSWREGAALTVLAVGLFVGLRPAHAPDPIAPPAAKGYPVGGACDGSAMSKYVPEPPEVACASRR